MSTRLAPTAATERPVPEPLLAAVRCGQCNDPLPPSPALLLAAPRPLCADCALDGVPHTD